MNVKKLILCTFHLFILSLTVLHALTHLQAYKFQKQQVVIIFNQEHHKLEFITAIKCPVKNQSQVNT